MSDVTGFRLDGAFKDPRDCPKTTTDWKGRKVCPECGDETDPSYGIGSGYGFGAYEYCLACSIVYDFEEDADE